MVNVSQVARKIIESRPMLQDALLEGIVNYANLAESIKPKVEAELGEKVERYAVIMALRRHSKNLKAKTSFAKAFKPKKEIIMKSGICDVCIFKTPKALEKLGKIHGIVDYEKGDTLNIIQGNYELTIVASQKHLEKIKAALKGEKILNIEKNLVSITIIMGKDFLYTPGALSTITRKLAWENINIFENISTMTELIFIISEKDATRAYQALQEMMKEE